MQARSTTLCLGWAGVLLAILSGAACSKGPANAGPPASAIAGDGGPMMAAVGLDGGSFTRMEGSWRIVEYDGHRVDAHGTPGADPREADYMAGASVAFEDHGFRLRRGSAVMTKRPVTLLASSDASVVRFSIGYGPSTMTFLDEHAARIHIDTIPAHDMLVERD